MINKKEYKWNRQIYAIGIGACTCLIVLSRTITM